MNADAFSYGRPGAIQASTARPLSLPRQPVIIAERIILKKPSRGALVLALIPFGAMCFSVPLWDRVDPIVLGLPFNLFWLVSWIVLSTLCMWVAYRLEAARNTKDGEQQ